MSDLKLILPPNYPAIGDDPLIFLAGPIQGSDDWRTPAIEQIRQQRSDVWIASPALPIQPDQDKVTQMDWETGHLKIAGRQGVILFWLAREATHACDYPHAKTTRSELFEWMVRHQYTGAKLVVGHEYGLPRRQQYSGLGYVLHRFSQECSDVPICGSLQETCQMAISIL